MISGKATAWWMALAVAGVMTVPKVTLAQTSQPSGGETASMAEVQTDAAANAALASFIERGARNALDDSSLPKAEVRRVYLLLRAAQALDPNEARYARVAAELALRLGEETEAVTLLADYRRLVPDDQLAMIRTIDLVADQQQNATDRLSYLEGIVKQPAAKVPSPVRSHAALLATRTLAEIGRDKPAIEMLDRSLELDPTNAMALQMMYEHLRVYGTSVERARLLTQMLKANPMQPAVISRIAAELDAEGSSREASQWYEHALKMSQSIGVQPSVDDVTNFTSLLLRANQAGPALQLAGSLINRADADTSTPLLVVLAARAAGNEENVTKALDGGRTVLVARLSQASAILNGREPPKDIASATMPDVAADVARIEQGNAAGSDQYLGMLMDLAWFDIYAAKKQPEPAVMNGLERLMDESAITLARLRGWSALNDGKIDEARQIFSGVADYDPLSKMGLTQIQAGDNAESVKEDATRLLASYRTGLLGALLHDGLKAIAGSMEPYNTSDVQKAVADFPIDLFKLPQAPGDFYGITIEPERQSYAFGEPMVLNITIFNRSQFPLTVGPQGVLKPSMFIGGSISGVAQQNVPRVATPSIPKAVVIQPREAISFPVRADAGPLFGALMQNPMVSSPVRFSALTNPIIVRQGDQQGLAPGGGGQQASSTRMADRKATPMSTDEQRAAFFDKMTRGSVVERLHSVDFLVGVISVAAQNLGQGEQAEATRKMLEQFIGRLAEQAQYDESPVVKAYAGMAVASFIGGDSRVNGIRRLLEDDLWSTRVLGLMIAPTLPAQQRTELLQPILNGDANELVKSLAQATLESSTLRDEMAAQQPKEQPRTVGVGEAVLEQSGK